MLLYSIMIKNSLTKTETKDDNKHIINSSISSCYPSLPSKELIIYLLIWIGGTFGTIFTLVKHSRVNSQKYSNARYVEEGLNKWIGRYQDTSDFEWSFWNEHFFYTIIVGYTGHFFIARLADYLIPNHRYKAYFMYSAAFTIHYLGVRGLTFIMFHSAVQFFMAALTKSVLMCWLTGCLLVFTLADETCLSYYREYVAPDGKFFFLLFATAMCNLRYIAFSIEYVWSHQNLKKNNELETLNNSNSVTKQTNEDKESDVRCRNKKCTIHEINAHTAASDQKETCLSFSDLLLYQMYYPLLYGGPIINYNEFAKQMKYSPVEWNRNNIKSFVVNVVRFLFWQSFVNFSLHFFYISAIGSDYNLLQRLPMFDLLGVALAQVLFFYMKYLVMYGLPSHFALSDNLKVPQGPHCVFARHRMTDMWKYFDKGLHAWLVRYIFIPCGGSRVNLIRSTINSFVTFAFVAFWHGASRSYLYWGFLSWLGVYVEFLALKFYRTTRVQEIESKYFTPQWSRRVRGILSSIMMSLLLTSNMYFLCGIRIGDLFWQRLYYENHVATVFIFCFLYCGTQCSMEFDRLCIYQ